MRRDELLEAALAAVDDRAAVYGEPDEVLGLVAAFWSIYLGVGIEPFDVTMLQALLKIARAKVAPQHPDSLVDLAGYAACGGEVAATARPRRRVRRRERA